MATCNSCNAPIIWAEHETTGRPMPFDEDPKVEPGPAQFAVVRGKYHSFNDTDARLHRPRHVSHFATCKQAAAWRRGGAPAPAPQTGDDE